MPILQNLTENKNASYNDFREAYYQLKRKFASNHAEFNQQVKGLKNLCGIRGVDHSAFELIKAENNRETKVVFADGVNIPLVQQPPAASNEPLSIGSILDVYKKQFSYFSFTLIKKSSTMATSVQRFAVVYGDRLERSTLKSKFNPDCVVSVKELNAKTLDPNFSWVILYLFHSAQTSRTDIHKSLELLKPYRVFDHRDFKTELTINWKNSDDGLFHDSCAKNEHNLIHHTLNAEQERLIKKFFSDNAGFLVCNLLSGGFSGSSVYLVFSLGVGDRKKLIIKLRERDGQNKLEEEHESFKSFVSPFQSAQYTECKYEKTLNYSAISYPFASVNSIESSISFGEMYAKCNDPYLIRSTIRTIFDHDFQKGWRGTSSVGRKIVKQAFVDVCSWEKAKSHVEELEILCGRNINHEQVTSVLDQEFDFDESINHGDLHSDNIQIDSKNSIHLIDFGMTGIFPTGFDYAVLECSVLFKLLDHSVESKIFEDIIVANIENFDSRIEYSERVIDPLQKAAKTCAAIRSQFIETFRSSPDLSKLKKQYLYCLFALCIRGLKYKDLNRRVLLLTLNKLARALS